nr:putative PQQ-dependent sugar dehydrogenase [uncultured bacterium]
MTRCLNKLITGTLCASLAISQLVCAQDYTIDTVLESLDSPWSLAFLPDGDMLITEIAGSLRLVKNGKLQKAPVTGVPEVYLAGQGGLMDVVVDRDFSNNQRIYLSFAHGNSDGNATRLVSARLRGNSLQDLQVLFTAQPLKRTPQHYGGRVAQLADGSLLLTIGDGFNYREQAQKLDSHLGKIVRINSNGEVPDDNPFTGVANALPEIWSLGHRNQQALLVSPRGVVFEHEHGPRGGDEINIIEPGLNYGWPVITRGVDYNGAGITPYTEYDGMQQPYVDWTPSIAPAGMTYYEGTMFPEWQGDLFVVSLAQKSVRHIDLQQGKFVSDNRIFPELDRRMRDIRTGPDGALYILTDGENGNLLRVSRN